MDDPALLPPPEGSPDPSTAAEPCRHLRNKAMYVYTQMADGSSHEDDDTTAFWCLRTATGFGPDDESVNRFDCRDPGRSCYQPI